MEFHIWYSPADIQYFPIVELEAVHWIAREGWVVNLLPKQFWGVVSIAADRKTFFICKTVVIILRII